MIIKFSRVAFLAIVILIVLSYSNVFSNSGKVNSTIPEPSQFAIFDFPLDERVWNELEDLGVGWVRRQYRIGEADKNLALTTFKTLISKGYGLWLTLYHRDSTNIADIESFRSSTRGAYPPKDPEVYKQLISDEMSEISDHIKSMGNNPGDWLIIQLCNEVQPIDIVGDAPSRFWHGTSQEYFDILELTSDAVKNSVEPSISIAAGGISSATLELLIEFGNNPNIVDTTSLQIFNFNDKLLREGVFDWADIHLRHRLDTMIDRIKWATGRWDGPLAATEIAGPDTRTGAIWTEELQAAELVERMDISLQNGIDKVFWASLIDDSTNTKKDSVFLKEGLVVMDTFRRKPAFFAYQNYIDTANTVTNVQAENIPINFSLSQNYPNPFNPETNIEYSVAKRTNVKISIYDLLGRKVKTLVNSFHIPGYYLITWNARNNAGASVPSGTYFYRATFDNELILTKKLLLLK